MLMAAVDHGQAVHGKCLVGVQAAFRQEGRISRLQSDALFDRADDSAEQQRGTSTSSASGACVGLCSHDRCLGKLQNGAGPRRHCDFPPAGGSDDVFAGVDHDALDAAVPHRACRECQFRIRQNI